MKEARAAQSEYEIERDKPVPSKNHAIVQGNTYFVLRQKYEQRYRIMPEVSLLLDEKERVPDIAVFPPLDFVAGQDDIRLVETPLAVIEILSPTQNLSDLIAKSYQYFEAGVQSYWLIIPDLMTVYVFSGPNDYEAYIKKGMLRDTKLNIELEIGDMFK